MIQGASEGQKQDSLLLVVVVVILKNQLFLIRNILVLESDPKLHSSLLFVAMYNSGYHSLKDKSGLCENTPFW